MLYILLSTFPPIPQTPALLTLGNPQISAPMSAHTIQKRTWGRPHYELHFAPPSVYSTNLCYPRTIRATEAYLEPSRYRGIKHLAVAILHTFDRTSPRINSLISIIINLLYTFGRLVRCPTKAEAPQSLRLMTVFLNGDIVGNSQDSSQG